MLSTGLNEQRNPATCKDLVPHWKDAALKRRPTPASHLSGSWEHPECDHVIHSESQYADLTSMIPLLIVGAIILPETGRSKSRGNPINRLSRTPSDLGDLDDVGTLEESSNHDKGSLKSDIAVTETLTILHGDCSYESPIIHAVYWVRFL